MNTVPVVCSHCGAQFKVRFAVRPKSTTCPKCKTLVAIPDDAKAEETNTTSTARQPPPLRTAEHGGIGRLGYYICSTLSFGIWLLLSTGGEGLGLLGLTIALFAQTVIMFQRLKNIGWSGWWALLIAIPVANLAVLLPCAILQEGYVATRRIDKTGKVLAACLAGATVLLALTIGIPAITQARSRAEYKACWMNMKMIGAAKEIAANQHNYTEGDEVPIPQISEQIKAGFSGLTCPKHGEYVVKPIGQEPECSVHGTPSNAYDKWYTRGEF